MPANGITALILEFEVNLVGVARGHFQVVVDGMGKFSPFFKHRAVRRLGHVIDQPGGRVTELVTEGLSEFFERIDHLEREKERKRERERRSNATMRNTEEKKKELGRKEEVEEWKKGSTWEGGEKRERCEDVQPTLVDSSMRAL